MQFWWRWRLWLQRSIRRGHKLVADSQSEYDSFLQYLPVMHVWPQFNRKSCIKIILGILTCGLKSKAARDTRRSIIIMSHFAIAQQAADYKIARVCHACLSTLLRSQFPLDFDGIIAYIIVWNPKRKIEFVRRSKSEYPFPFLPQCFAHSIMHFQCEGLNTVASSYEACGPVFAFKAQMMRLESHCTFDVEKTV